MHWYTPLRAQRNVDYSGKAEEHFNYAGVINRNFYTIMPLSEEKKAETRDRLNRDPDFREAFTVEARNMYMKALKYNPGLENEINRFEQIMGADPDAYEFDQGEMDEVDIFEQILNAYDNQVLMEEKNNSTIN